MSVILKNMDCFEMLKSVKSNSVDLVLIDPPYEISRPTNFASGEATGKDTDRFRISMEFGDWDSKFLGLDTFKRYRIDLRLGV